MKKPQQEKLLTRRQCAEFLSVTLSTLRTWVKDGTVNAYQLGGRIYFRRSEILKSLRRVKAFEAM